MIPCAKILEISDNRSLENLSLVAESFIVDHPIDDHIFGWKLSKENQKLSLSEALRQGK